MASGTLPVPGENIRLLNAFSFFCCRRHCHSLREKADVFYTGPAVSRVAGKGDCAAASAPEDDSCLARLSFEAEIIGDMERSVRLQKCRLLSEPGKDNADRWYELARLLMRAGEVHVEEAEEALWKSISLQGGPEKVCHDVLVHGNKVTALHDISHRETAQRSHSLGCNRKVCFAWHASQETVLHTAVARCRTDAKLYGGASGLLLALLNGEALQGSRRLGVMVRCRPLPKLC